MDNKKNLKGEIEFEIKDLSIDDAEVQLDVEEEEKINNKDTNITEKVDHANDMKDVSNDTVEDSKPEKESFEKDSKDSKATTDSQDDKHAPKTDALEEKKDEGVETPNNIDQNNDTRNLKEKAKDTKEKIKNAPDDIKNKINDTKDKINDTKDKIKNAPENVKNKVNETKDRAKDTWQNRPKNMRDMKDKFKGSNIKDKLKNGTKNRAKKVANNMKDNAIDSFNNTGLGSKIGKTKDAIDKGKKIARGTKKVGNFAAKAGKAVGKAAAKAASSLLNLFITTLPWSAIIIGIVLLFALIVFFVSSLVPGVGGDINNEDSYSEYADVDQRTLEKLKKHIQKYPNADAPLALSVVLYPYFDNLYSGNVSSYLTLNATEEEEEIEEETEEDGDYDEEDYEDIEDTEEEATADPYLIPLRKSKVMRRVKKVLKKLSTSSEEEFKTYLKEEYFKSDNGYIGFDDEFITGYNGYKKMLKEVEEEKKEEFFNSVIEDIYSNKEFFVNYVYEAYSCTTELHSAGTVDIDEMLRSNILVDVKVPSCKSGEGVWDCESVYSNPISLKQYVFGGAYEEFNSMDIEKTAAQMLAIKSFIVSRSESMGWDVKQDESGNYIVTVRNNTNDLVYCDIDLGCKDGNTMVGDGNTKRDPISDKQRDVYEKAWEKVVDKYIYDKDKNKTVGAFCQSRSGVCDFCEKGSCLAHDELERYTNTSYDAIIGMQYSNYSMIQVEGEYANVTVAGEADCSGTTTLDIDDSNFVYYAQTDYPNVAFCGRTLNNKGDGLCAKGSSICSSGCGLTSMAMVAATLTQNYSINPLTLNNEVRVGTDCGPNITGTSGGNMFPYVANKYGLTVTSKHAGTNAINDIKQGLDEGGLIIASVCGGLKANNTYTDGCGGHFIVVRGYEGNDIIISDPYQNSRLKAYSGCLLKNGEKCIKHKMDINTFYSDLRNKNSTLYIIKGETPFYELKQEATEE